jgi:hypothetical protein
MRIIVAAVVAVLAGCANPMSYIPSFWDDNQSAKIVDLTVSVQRLDCARPQLVQVERIRDNLLWFHVYSSSKGARQADVLRLIEPIEATVEDFYKRVSAEGHKDNKIYCDLKKRVMEAQAKTAAKAVLGRF